MRSRLFFAVVVLLMSAAPLWAENWPAWRGPSQQGVTTETDLPVSWNRNENVRWRIELPERGNSTPVVWEDQIFLTQPLEEEGRRTLMTKDERRENAIAWPAASFADVARPRSSRR